MVPAVPPSPPQAVGQQCLTTLSLLPSTVIRGRSADNRKALLNSRCPLRGHRVYEGNNANVVPLLPYAGPTLPDLAILCRIATWGRSLTLRAFLPAFNRHPERSEGSRFKTIVNQLSLNTGRQEATSSPPLVPDGTTFPYRWKNNRTQQCKKPYINRFPIDIRLLFMEPATGFEPATYALRMRRSTS